MGRRPGSVPDKHAAEVLAKTRAHDRARARADETLADRNKAIRRAARAAGASMAALGELTGLTKASIQKIIREGDR